VRRGVARALAAVVLAAFPAAQAVGAPKRVAILDLVTEGMSADVQGQFETTIEEELRKSGYLVVSHATTLDVIAKKELTEGCTFGRCVEPIGAALGVGLLLDVRISAEGPSYSFVLSLVEAKQGTPIGQVVTACPVCTVSEALGKLGGLVAALDGQSRPMLLRDTGPIVTLAPSKRSKVLPALLVAGGLAMGAGGTALVAGTEQKEAGWVTIGSGGTVFLTGLILLLTGD
jgi:hypothetical protein